MRLKYPSQTVINSLAELESLCRQLQAKPVEEQNEWASIWLSQLVQQLKPQFDRDETDLTTRLKDLLKQGHMIRAIKLHRAETDSSLMESKLHCEVLQQELNRG